MFKETLLTLAVCGLSATPAFAQFDGDFGPDGGFHRGVGGTAGAAGVQRRDTDRTGAQSWQDRTPDANTGIAPTAPPGRTFTTGRGTLNAGDIRGPLLPPTTTTQMGVGPGITVDINHLPRTTYSSIIEESGFDENIWSDEGTTGRPPLEGFYEQNTIGAGMHEPYMSTGHASNLPSSWLETGQSSHGTFPGD